MNSINIVWDSTKLAETSYFHCGPEIREKGILGKKEKKKNSKFRMINSKENTLTYMHMYIYTHPRTFKYIYNIYIIL